MKKAKEKQPSKDAVNTCPVKPSTQFITGRKQQEMRAKERVSERTEERERGRKRTTVSLAGQPEVTTPTNRRRRGPGWTRSLLMWNQITQPIDPLSVYTLYVVDFDEAFVFL